MSNINRIQPETTTRVPQIKGTYVAQISQAGTAAPTLVVIKNTLPTTGQPVWTREATGVYRFTSAVLNYFPAGLVTWKFTFNRDVTQLILMRNNSTEQITIATADFGVLADSILAFTPIEITIWDRLQD